MRLTILTKTEKEREADESSSTHQLADSENGHLEDYVHDDAPTGIYTMISSEANNWRTQRNEEELDLTNIHVRQETVVQVKGK